MGIAQRDPVAVEQAEEEPEHDLAVAIARRLVEHPDRLEALALDVLRDEHPAGAEVGPHPRHADERVAAEAPLHPPLLLCLELVVELLADALTQLGQQRLGVQAGREPLEQRQQQPRAAQVAVDRLGHARVLDLHDHVFAVERRRPMHLTDRGRGERPLVEGGEHAAQRPAQLLAHQLLEPLERHGRDVVAQRRELGLQLAALFRGQLVELDHREQLPDLHRRAAHLAQLVDEFSDELRRPLVARLRRPLRRAHPVGRAHPRPPQPLPGDHPADLRRASDPPLRQPCGFGGRIVVGVHPSNLKRV